MKAIREWNHRVVRGAAWSVLTAILLGYLAFGLVDLNKRVKSSGERLLRQLVTQQRAADVRAEKSIRQVIETLESDLASAVAKHDREVEAQLRRLLADIRGLRFIIREQDHVTIIMVSPSPTPSPCHGRACRGGP